MQWPFQTKESNRRRHEKKEQDRKYGDATRMIADLFIRHYRMTNADIISELERMHRFYAVASWAPSDEPGGYFVQIVTDLSHPSLTTDEIGRLVAMLLWPELRTYKVRGAPSCFVLTAMQNPSEPYIPTLTEHLAWREEEIRPLGSSQYRTDIASEIRLTKGAIQACRLRP